MNFPQGQLKLGLGTVALTGALVLAGCADNMDYSELRVIHASKDAPKVNVRVGFKNEIKDLDYADSSGYVSVRSGTRKLAVEAQIPSGNEDVITVKRFNFETDERYNILAINDAAEIEALPVAESAATPGLDEVAIAVVHASTNAGEVEVYVTAPGIPLDSVDPNFSFGYTDVVDAGPLPAVAYQIRVVDSATGNLVYDSGTVDLAGFAGDKLLLAALSTENSTEAAESPIKLLAANDIAHLVLLDVDTPVGARVVHLSPDVGSLVGAVEVFATSSALGAVPVEIIPSFEYTDKFPGTPTDSSYAPIPAGVYDFAVAPDGAGIGGAVPDTLNDVELSSGGEYTVIAAGNVATAPAFDLLPSVDDNRSIVTQASVKVVHAAPAAGPVDVYVTPGGQFDAGDVLSGAAGNPLLEGFEFGTITDYVPVPPNDVEGYDIRVVQISTNLVAIEALGVPLPAGLVASVIARQPDGDGDPAAFGLEVLTN